MKQKKVVNPMDFVIVKIRFLSDQYSNPPSSPASRTGAMRQATFLVDLFLQKLSSKMSQKH